MSLPTDFPPRTITAPILIGAGNRRHTSDLVEIEDRLESMAGASNRGGYTAQGNMPMSRLVIPAFNGGKLHWWFSHCERFSHYYGVVDNQKVNLAATYLNDITNAWFQGWSGGRSELNWQEFAEEFCDRFGERAMTNVVEEFSKLKQEGVVDDYLIKFEELRLLLMFSHPTLE